MGRDIWVLIIDGNWLLIPGSPVMNHAIPIAMRRPIRRWGQS